MLHPGAQVNPPEMEATGTPGWARIAFLVRTDGTADPCAIRALESSDGRLQVRRGHHDLELEVLQATQTDLCGADRPVAGDLTTNST